MSYQLPFDLEPVIFRSPKISNNIAPEGEISGLTEPVQNVL